MDMDLRWLDEKGINTKDGLAYTGATERYLSALQRYFKGYESNADIVRELLDAGDYDGYAIKVHALKSNSRMIGAAKLGDAFEELELAAKNGDTSLIADRTGDVLNMYLDVIEAIRPIGEAENVKVTGELTASEAIDIAGRLLSALDDFDDELAAELAEKLRGYPFRITQRDKLKEAISNIGDFMYDEAAELINEIIPSIE